MTTRRTFLQRSSLLGFGASVPSFLGRTAFAAPTADNAPDNNGGAQFTLTLPLS